MIPRFSAECMVCAISRQAENMPDQWSDEKRAAYLRQIMQIITDADLCEGAPVVNGKIDALNKEYGIPERDYTQIKKDYNNLMMDIFPRLTEKINISADPLAEAIKLARTGNYIDFGTQVKVTKEELFELIERSSREELNDIEYNYLKENLEKADSLVYLTDNCGEIVTDMILIKKMKDLYPGINITAIVRGMPVLNDATIEDAQMVGLDKIVDVMGNGNGIAGTFIDKMDDISRSVLEKADVIISKGQANFETLNGCGMNIYYLFLCKCRRFERRFNMSKFQGVLANDRRLEV